MLTSELLIKVLALVGLAKLLALAISFAGVLSGTLLPTGTSLATYGSKRKSWAVVTGATAGIGEQFVHQLAKAGFQVCLVSRTKSKLEKVASEVEAKYSTKTAIFVLDAARAGPTKYAEFEKFVESLGSVSVLINNVGQSHEMPVPFTETSSEEMHAIIKINNFATLDITKAVLPTLEKTVGKSRGLILTIGSFSGLTPTPLLATYSGSKAFLQGWSSALAAELSPKRIDVQIVLSYLVTSNMSKIKRTSLMIPDPRSFVRSTLRSLGRRGGAQERAFTATPYWSHALLHWAIENTVGVYSSTVATINRTMHVDIRRRALRKQERLAKVKAE